MTPSILKMIRELTATDLKNLDQKMIKTMEEVGELSKWLLAYQGAFATTHRGVVARKKILEEIADSYICILSVAHEMGFSDDDLQEMILEKLKKWAERQTRELNANFPVPFEIHVTVRTDNIPSFRDACALIGVKPIVLDLQNQSGTSILQDVMTSSTLLGTNPQAYQEMERISEDLASRGFTVLRQKIETAPWHPSAPSATHMEPKMPENCYFEAHFGVLSNDDKKGDLHDIAVKTGAHLSRNIFKRVSEDSYKVMLTARRYTGTREDFEEYASSVRTALVEGGFEVEKTITEFSVFDTRVSHDASWINS